MPAVIPIAASVAGAAISSRMNRSANQAAANANQASADAAGLQAQIAADQYADWKKDFLPLQGQMVADAKDAGGAQDQARAAEAAAGDVGLSFGKAKASLSDRLNSYGIDPTQGKYAANFTDIGLAEAAASAGAQTRARTNAIDRGRAYRADVYGLGRGVPASSSAGLASAASTNAAIAANAGNTASRNAAGVGHLIQQGVQGLQNWWNQPSAGGSAYTPPPGLGPQ